MQVNFFVARGCYFQVGNSVKLGMSIPVAFRMALETWASWVENKIDTNRTRVFFRTYEPSHWRYFSISDTTMLCFEIFSVIIFSNCSNETLYVGARFYFIFKLSWLFSSKSVITKWSLLPPPCPLLSLFYLPLQTTSPLDLYVYLLKKHLNLTFVLSMIIEGNQSVQNFP